eukprot:Sspe_Gene.44020::Locus_21549_Transcript_1_3_Confidence_0.500_Length_2184::g.44020::m.44020/K05970/SIAE; sialate O-acetylesterase
MSSPPYTMTVPSLFVLLFASAEATVYLNGLFSDHMVLQRPVPDMHVPPARIYGTADPSETVRVALGGVGSQSFAVHPNSDGGWSQSVSPIAGKMGPYTVTVTGGDGNSTTISDVFFGDVLLCSGQSNMELQLRATDNATAEEAAAHLFPNLRLFTVEHHVSDTPVDYALNGSWKITNSSNAADFSAVCYISGRILTEYLQRTIPTPYVGLVDSNIGGTTVHHWAPPSVGVACNTTGMLPSSGEAAQHPPGWCWNSMIHPISMNGTGFVVRQVTYYQGEADSGENDRMSPDAYACELSNLIRGWRAMFGYPTMPFIVVQLPGGNGGCSLTGIDDATPSGWQGIQWAQERVYRSVPHTGLVTAGDQGCCGLHYAHKSEVARRAALWGQYLTFADASSAPEGPRVMYAAKKAQDSKSVTVRFSNFNGLRLQPSYKCDTFKPCVFPGINATCCSAGAPNIFSLRLSGIFYHSGRPGHHQPRLPQLWGWVPATVTSVDPEKGVVTISPVLPPVGTTGWPYYYSTYLGTDPYSIDMVAVMQGGSGCSLVNAGAIPLGTVGPFRVQVDPLAP